MKLEKVLKYKKGKSPQKGQNDENLILYLTPEYLRGNSIPNYIPDFSAKVEVLDGDLLLLWDGSNAGEFFKGKKGILSSTMVKFDYDKLEYNSDFLFYQLKAFEGYLKAQTNGSGIPHVDKEILLGLEIENFKKPEQTRIAEILSTADEAIALTEALIAKYQRIKTGLMQDLLTKGIDENGNIRSKETHKFVVKNGIEVPEEWEVDTFSQFCSIIKDGTHLPPKRVTDGIWLLGVSNIIGGEWTLTNSDTQISEEFYNQMHKNWQIEIGDVLLAIVGATIGKVTQVPTNFPKFTLQRSVCLLRGKEKELSNDFLRLFIESLYFQRLLWNEVNVTAQPGIYLDTIGKFLIGKPRFEEQLMIVDKLSSIKETIDSLLTNLAKLQSLKTGLMQDLLSGKVRVNMDNKN